MHYIRTALAAAMVVGSLAAAAPARATAGPFAMSLEDFRFDDGGVASGYFTVDSYGFLSTPQSIVTTAGSVLAGFTYVPGTPRNNTAQTFDFSFADYSGELHLEFANPLDAGGTDALVLGGASYECIDECATKRFLVTGDVVVQEGQDPIYIPPPGPIPEPASLAMLASGLLGLAMRRAQARTRPAAAG